MKVKPASVLIVSVATSVIISVGINFIPSEIIYSANWYLSIIFHLLISFALNLILFRKKSNPEDFVNKIMFTSFGRLLLCMIGVFIYSFIDKPHFIGFALHFMLHYIVFTILEIKYLLNYVKNKSHE